MFLEDGYDRVGKNISIEREREKKQIFSDDGI